MCKKSGDFLKKFVDRSPLRGIINNELLTIMAEEYSCFSDLELLARSEGSQDAMHELISRYTRLVRACARPLFLAGGDHEDLVQEGMIGLLDAIRSFAPELGTPFDAYAALCVRRRMYSAIRAASARKHAPLNDALPLEDLTVSRTDDPEAEVISRERHRELRERLNDCLSSTERTVLEHYLEGLSYLEISRRVGKPIKSVDNAVQRIRRKAAAILGENGHPV